MNDAQASHPVHTVIANIVEKRSIDADQVRQLENFVAEDWVIDETEIRLLFQVNQALGQRDSECPEWPRFFIRSVNRLVVMDMNTPGQIDEPEGDLLFDLLEQFAAGNDSEDQLLRDLSETTRTIAGRLATRIQPN